MHAQVWRRSFGGKRPNAGGDLARVESCERVAGDEDLAGLGCLDEPGGDVDVDAEVVAADLARPPDVNARAQLGPIALRLQRSRALARGERRLDRARGVPESGHQTVAEPLDYLAPAPEDRGLDGVADVTEQGDGGTVAGLERPGRKAGEVGEEDRHVEVPATAAVVLGEALPGL